MTPAADRPGEATPADGGGDGPADGGAGIEPGDDVGAWVVEHRLGAGGMAVVFAAQNRVTGHRGALKILRRELSSSPEIAARFKREARALLRVQHEAVVPVLDAGKLGDGRPWLVTAQLEGRTLREELDRRRSLPPDEAWTIARSLLDALALAHSLGVVHRDVKPANVFLEVSAAGPQARLIDFGLAKLPAQGDDAQLSRTGVALGTPAYMAPEQWWGDRAVDGRADLYGVGATLFEMLAGAPPFGGRSEPELLQAVLHDPPPSPRDRGAPVGTGADVFVRRLLAKDPADRFPNAWTARSTGDHAFEREAAEQAARAPIERAPIERAPIELAPIELAPIERAPIERAPIERAPIELAPIERAPRVAAAPAALRAPLELAHAPGAPAAFAAPSPVRAAPPRHRDPLEARGYTTRYVVLHAVVAALGVAVVVGVGYAGAHRHDVGGWMEDGGWGMLPLIASFVAAVVVIPTLGLGRALRGETGHRVFALAAAPALLGAAATWLDWIVVRGVVADMTPARAFAVLHQGMVEAHVPRFVGFALGAIAFLLVCAVPTRRFREQRFAPWRVVDAATLLLLGTAAAGITASASSGVFVALIAAGATGLGRGLSLLPTRIRFAEALDHAVASIAATLLAVGAALARLDALAAAPFGDPSITRAERVVAIVAAAEERAASRVVAVIAVLVVIGLAGARLWVLRPAHGRLRLPRSGMAVLLAMPAFFAIDAVQLGAFRDRRAALETALAPQFALFAALDPPRAIASTGLSGPSSAPALAGPSSAPALSGPSSAPALQATLDVVAVNGRPIARMDALASAATRDGVVQELARAVAESPPAANRPDLALVVDREVPWSQVRELLRLARQGGVRRVEVLLTRGAAAPIPPDAPEGAAATVPDDFVALPIGIAVAGPTEWAGATFEDVAASWQDAMADGKTVLVGVGW